MMNNPKIATFDEADQDSDKDSDDEHKGTTESKKGDEAEASAYEIITVILLKITDSQI